MTPLTLASRRVRRVIALSIPQVLVYNEVGGGRAVLGGFLVTMGESQLSDSLETNV